MSWRGGWERATVSTPTHDESSPLQYTPQSMPPSGARAPRRRRHRVRLIGILLASAVVALVGGVSLAIAHNGVVPSRPVGVASPTATTAPYIAADVDAYTSTIPSDAQLLRNDMSTMSSACSNVKASSLHICQATIETIEMDAASFQDDVNAIPAPPCLHTADVTVRQALALVQEGTQEAINGILDTNPSEVNAGAAMYPQASSELDSAVNQIRAAQC